VPGATDTLVAIGCSAGGPAALAKILSALEPINQAAVVIVQHIDARFVEDLALWLKGFCNNPLHLVSEGDLIEPGHIYLAGKEGHVEAHACSRLRYDADLRGLAYHPSVDMFFASIARNWRGRALGIVLTGMGRDGAAGLHAMRDAGCHTIAQDAASSSLFGMPKAAAPFAAEVLPLSSIAPRINQWIRSNK
jgi:chemotaxis response regulator CheB